MTPKPARRNGKSPKESPDNGALVTPLHGRGRIRHGSLPGNTPGTGRPPSEIREKMRGSLADRLAIAEQIADNKKSTDSDRLKALDFLAKYGLGTTMTETDTEGNDVTVRVVRQPRRAVG